MHYTNRKDDGTYISSSGVTLGLTTLTKEQLALLRPIAYNKDIADIAAQQKRKYREVFLEATKGE